MTKPPPIGRSDHQKIILWLEILHEWGFIASWTFYRDDWGRRQWVIESQPAGRWHHNLNKETMTSRELAFWLHGIFVGIGWHSFDQRVDMTEDWNERVAALERD